MFLSLLHGIMCLSPGGRQEVPCFLIWCLWDLWSQVPSTRPFSCSLWSPATPQPGLGPTPGRPLFCNSCLPPTEPTVKLCSPTVQPSAHRASSLLSQIPCVSRESQGLWCEQFIQRGWGQFGRPQALSVFGKFSTVPLPPPVCVLFLRK